MSEVKPYPGVHFYTRLGRGVDVRGQMLFFLLGDWSRRQCSIPTDYFDRDPQLWWEHVCADFWLSSRRCCKDIVDKRKLCPECSRLYEISLRGGDVKSKYWKHSYSNTTQEFLDHRQDEVAA